MDTPIDNSLRHHLHHLTALDPPVVDRIIEEILTYYHETVDGFVVRRHRELQRQGQTNTQIFSRIEHELQQHRFQSPTLSQRQIRRIIYG